MVIRLYAGPLSRARIIGTHTQLRGDTAFELLHMLILDAACTPIGTLLHLIRELIDGFAKKLIECPCTDSYRVVDVWSQWVLTVYAAWDITIMGSYSLGCDSEPCV